MDGLFFYKAPISVAVCQLVTGPERKTFQDNFSRSFDKWIIHIGNAQLLLDVKVCSSEYTTYITSQEGNVK